MKSMAKYAVTALISAAAAWRFTAAFSLVGWAAWLCGAAIAVLLFLLLQCTVRSSFAALRKAACIPGLLCSFFFVLGCRMQQGGFPADAGGWLLLLLDFALFSVALSVLVLWLYRIAEKGGQRELRTEKTFSKLLGSGFVLFLVLLLCWLPTWLALYPGTFGADNVTQVEQVFNEELTTHHPLLHTLWLGQCMNWAYEWSPEGELSVGVAMFTGIQLVLMAAAVAWSLHKLYKHHVPLIPRVVLLILFALLPFYGVWGVCAHKDVPFAGLCMLMLMQLIELPQTLADRCALRRIFKLLAFVLTAVLMMLMRRNGVYALLLSLPVMITCTGRGLRCRVSLLMCLCLGLYIGADRLLISVTEADDDAADTAVEMLSVPLQQLARITRDHPEVLTQEDWDVLNTLYDGESPSVYYYEPCSDPVKWALIYDELDTPELLKVWLRVFVRDPLKGMEATLIQNLPYYMPGAEMDYYFDLGTQSIDMYELHENSLFPAYKSLLREYDQTAGFAGIPLTRSFGDAALYVWLCIALLVWAAVKKKKQIVIACTFLLGIWITCLLGPIANLRYMLSLFYAMPLLIAEAVWGRANDDMTAQLQPTDAA